MKLIYECGAIRDLRKAFDYYEAERNGLGSQFAQCVAEAVDRLCTNPRAWQRIGRRIRRCLPNRFPYGVLYAIKRDAIVIVAVMDLRRHPDTWRHRQ